MEDHTVLAHSIDHAAFFTSLCIFAQSLVPEAGEHCKSMPQCPVLLASHTGPLEKRRVIVAELPCGCNEDQGIHETGGGNNFLETDDYAGSTWLCCFIMFPLHMADIFLRLFPLPPSHCQGSLLTNPSFYRYGVAIAPWNVEGFVLSVHCNWRLYGLAR